MKYLLLIFISFSAMASFLPESKIGKDTSGIKIYTKKKKCQKVYPQEKCCKIGTEYRQEYSVLADEMVDDPDSPTWGTRSKVTSCSDEQDCQDQLVLKSCNGQRSPYMNAEFTETWCNKITGYDSVPTGRKVVVSDAAKKATYDSEQNTKENEESTKKNTRKDLKKKIKDNGFSSLTGPEKDQIMLYFFRHIN